MQEKYQYGMIGLGTMGRNLVYNMADHGYSVAGFDKDAAKVASLTGQAPNDKVGGFSDLPSFINALQAPRVIMLLVPAGPVVDIVTGELRPYLSPGDLIMDCGNSHFTDTDRRIAQLETEHIHFMGVGISGGEFGARNGPSIMPGGQKDIYARIAPMLEAVAAKADGRACVAYMGAGSAGHYVKMVHNGIEYGLMQLISEAYHMLKGCCGTGNEKLAEVFSKWNAGRLQSYLIEITATIFTKADDNGSGMLIDHILDASRQNGTGQWTTQSAMDLFVPAPVIDAAVAMRNISAMRDERIAAAAKLPQPASSAPCTEAELAGWLEDALYSAFIITYGQGMALLQVASAKYNYGLKIDEVAAIWRGGCIIRSALLEEIMDAWQQNASLANLMCGHKLAGQLNASVRGLRQVVSAGAAAGIPMPAMMASLAYFDSYRSAWLPANLIQAQRDYFGAHTYERTDMQGIFHTQWDQKS